MNGILDFSDTTLNTWCFQRLLAWRSKSTSLCEVQSYRLYDIRHRVRLTARSLLLNSQCHITLFSDATGRNLVCMHTGISITIMVTIIANQQFDNTKVLHLMTVFLTCWMFSAFEECFPHLKNVFRIWWMFSAFDESPSFHIRPSLTLSKYGTYCDMRMRTAPSVQYSV